MHFSQINPICTESSESRVCIVCEGPRIIPLLFPEPSSECVSNMSLIPTNRGIFQLIPTWENIPTRAQRLKSQPFPTHRFPLPWYTYDYPKVKVPVESWISSYTSIRSQDDVKPLRPTSKFWRSYIILGFSLNFRHYQRTFCTASVDTQRLVLCVGNISATYLPTRMADMLWWQRTHQQDGNSVLINLPCWLSLPN